MFGNRQKLDMGKAHFHHIGDQLFRHGVPIEEPVLIIAHP
jgi:hypothetical protein